MDEAQSARYQAEARKAEATVFWEDLSQIVGFLLTSWQTYGLALAIWALTKIF